MVLKAIYKPEFCDGNRTLHLYLEISPRKTLSLECTLQKANETWRVSASIICTVAQNQKNPPLTYTCQLPPIVLQPMDTRVIGAWYDVFWKENQWPIPLLMLEDEQLDPIESLDRFANQNLLEIKAYKNGFTLKSEYLQLETNQ
jgi:hypothetical protein